MDSIFIVKYRVLSSPVPFLALLQEKGRSQAIGVLVLLLSKSYSLPLDVSFGYEQSGNKDSIDLWSLHLLPVCLQNISRIWDCVYILSNPSY